MEFLLPLLYASLFILIIFRMQFFRSCVFHPRIFAVVFLLKIFAGTFLWFLYTHYYPDRSTADIFKYFDDGKVMYDALSTHPADYFKMLLGFPDASLDIYYQKMQHWFREFNQGMYEENRTMIRFNAMVFLFSFGNYHVHTVCICFLSLCGLAGIFKTFSVFFPERKKEIFAAVFLLPSVLFWGSGVLKESLALFFMGIFIFHFFKIARGKFSPSGLFSVILFCFLLFITKFYLLAALFPALAAYLWVCKTNGKFPELKYGITIILVLLLGIVFPGYDLREMLVEKQRHSINVANGGSFLENKKTKLFVYIKPEIKNRIEKIPGRQGYCKILPGTPYIFWNTENPPDSGFVESSTDTATYWVYFDMNTSGSKINVPILKPSFFSLLQNAPFAFATTLLRPHVFEIRNMMYILPASENLILLLLIFLSVLFPAIKINRPVIYWCITVTALLFTLIGLTTPILGAVVRYKVPAMIFLFIALTVLVNKEKMNHTFQNFSERIIKAGR